MFNRLAYTISEAFRGLIRHRMVIVPSVATIFLCSFLLIVSLSVLQTAFLLSAKTNTLYRAEAFFLADVDESSIDSIAKEISEWNEVLSINLISKQQALEEFKNNFPEDMLNMVEDNPLPASILLQVRPSEKNGINLQNVIRKLGDYPEIAATQSPLEWISRWEKNKERIFFIPLAVSALMFFILWLIMNNAVKLTLLSRRELVENIKYSGGTPFFIQFPFVIEGLLQGFMGAGLAAILWAILQNYLIRAFPVIAEFSGGSWRVVLLSMLLIAFSEAVVSYLTVRRFLVKGL